MPKLWIKIMGKTALLRIRIMTNEAEPTAAAAAAVGMAMVPGFHNRRDRAVTFGITKA